MIVLMAGLPGTGKTTLARELATRTSGSVICKDDVRHALFSPTEIAYSTRQDDFCLQVMLQTASYLLIDSPQRTIFLDGRTFSRRYQALNVVNFADSLHQDWRILECVCDEAVVRRRLMEPSAGQKHPAVNRNFELYLEMRARLEEITLPKTLIDTGRSTIGACVEKGLAALL